MSSLAPDIAARVERERAAHTEDDVLGRSVALKNRFAHIWTYPGLRQLMATFDGYLQDVEGQRVLDFGCGRGERSVALLERGAEVWGIDISPNYIAEAEARARAAGHPDAAFHFTAADAHALPYPEAQFDLVVGEGILHHLDLQVALAEVHRVLKPGGRALFCEPLLDNPLLKLFRRVTPAARTEDERPLDTADLAAIADAGRWRVESSYCGLVGAPTAVLTSVVLRPYPNNVLLRAADRLEQAMNRWARLQPLNQYVLLNLVRA